MAWRSERRRLVGATLGAGHAGTANGAREFLAHAVTRLPTGHQIGLVRADSGVFVTAFREALAARDLPSILVARLTPRRRKLVVPRSAAADWRLVARGIAVADGLATWPAWRGQRRRFVGLRPTLAEPPDARGRRLIACPGSTYRGLVTPGPFAAEWGTRMDAGRADRENRIKELKEDVSLDTCCRHSFDATAAAFRTGGVRYNLLLGFREPVRPTCWVERRLRAVRDRVFLVGAELLPPARRLRVRLAVPREARAEVLTRLRTLWQGLPIAAQLEWDLTEVDEEGMPPTGGFGATGPTVWRAADAHGASP